jgi:hypothetical protein
MRSKLHQVPASAVCKAKFFLDIPSLNRQTLAQPKEKFPQLQHQAIVPSLSRVTKNLLTDSPKEAIT